VLEAKKMSSSSSSIIDQNLSLFIPHVFSSITEERIAKVFESNNIGIVKRVDFVNKVDKKGKSYNSVFVHFSTWFEDSVVANFQERVLNPDKEARIVYDDPWYWIVLKNNGSQRLSVTVVEETESLVSASYATMLEEKLAEANERIAELQDLATKLLDDANESSSWAQELQAENRDLLDALRDAPVY
jgi:hypothetical protein